MGPVDLYGEHISKNVENAWQYSKVYIQHTDSDGYPSQTYFAWAENGWSFSRANRYPMGKGAKPLYSWWDGQILSYLEARRIIYAPLYYKAVRKTPAFKRLTEQYAREGELWLWDFDGYDHHALNMNYKDVLNCETKKMGHAFVLAMMLDREKVWME